MSEAPQPAMPATMSEEMERVWREAFDEQCHRRMKGGRGSRPFRMARFPESAEQFAYRCLVAHLAGQPKPKATLKRCLEVDAIDWVMENT